MIKKFSKSIMAIFFVMILLINFLPVVSTKAADSYGKINKTYNNKFLTPENGEYDNNLKKGYTNVYHFKHYNGVLDLAGMYISLYNVNNAVYDIRLEDENGNIVFEKKKSSKNYNNIFLPSNKYYNLKIKAHEDIKYKLILRPSWGYDVLMDYFYLFKDNKEVTLKSPIGKVTWYKVKYNSNSQKYNSRKIATGSKLKVTSKNPGQYGFKKGGLWFIYDVENVSPFDRDKEYVLTDYLRAKCHLLFTGELHSIKVAGQNQRPYILCLNGYNHTSNTIVKVTAKADNKIYGFNCIIEPYDEFYLTKKIGDDPVWAIQKVVYTFADGTKETVFNDEAFIWGESYWD